MSKLDPRHRPRQQARLHPRRLQRAADRRRQRDYRRASWQRYPPSNTRCATKPRLSSPLISVVPKVSQIRSTRCGLLLTVCANCSTKRRMITPLTWALRHRIGEIASELSRLNPARSSCSKTSAITLKKKPTILVSPVPSPRSPTSTSTTHSAQRTAPMHPLKASRISLHVAGLLMEKEITYLGKALESPEKPFVAIIGGSKISGKIDVISTSSTRSTRWSLSAAWLIPSRAPRASPPASLWSKKTALTWRKPRSKGTSQRRQPAAPRRQRPR